MAPLVCIDRFMSEVRALTSMISNCVAAITDPLWEDACDRQVLARELKQSIPNSQPDEESRGGSGGGQALDAEAAISRLREGGTLALRGCSSGDYRETGRLIETGEWRKTRTLRFSSALASQRQRLPSPVRRGTCTTLSTPPLKTASDHSL